MSAVADHRRKEFIQAAASVFETKGVRHATISDITDAMGVTRSLFYHYFKDKDDIVNATIDELKQKGVWIFGTAAEGSIPMYKADLTVPAAVVIGSEGDGMSRLVRKNCDVTVNIPMKGRISSLNASAAASILLYEAVRQRLG